MENNLSAKITPAYLHLSETGELELHTQAAHKHLIDCDLHALLPC